MSCTQLGTSSSCELLKLASAEASGDFTELWFVLLTSTGQGLGVYWCPGIKGCLCTPSCWESSSSLGLRLQARRMTGLCCCSGDGDTITSFGGSSTYKDAPAQLLPAVLPAKWVSSELIFDVLRKSPIRAPVQGSCIAPVSWEQL